MRSPLLVLALALFSTASLAADTSEPVREVMRITEENWNSGDDELKSIFDADPLTRLFSSRFREAYAEASKHPAYETENGGAGDPFGYDVITASQDGCPLKEVNIVPAPAAGAKSEVTVTFKLWTCVDDADLKDGLNEVRFDVVEENGKPVIDDIHRVADGESDSLIEEMQAIAKGE
jgi:hypothetical protein